MAISEKHIGITLIVVGVVWLGLNATQILRAPNAVAQQDPAAQNADVKRTPCKVLSVYDGDTFACDLNGNGQIDKPTEQIRMLGVDSPEMHYSRKNKTYRSGHPVDEPGAKGASVWLEQALGDKTIYLEFDESREDKYGRTLAFVYASENDPVSLNEQTLALGHAQTLFLGRNRRYEARFQKTEAEARQQHRGIWAEQTGREN